MDLHFNAHRKIVQLRNRVVNTYAIEIKRIIAV